MGIGETMADRLQYGDKVLFAGDLEERRTVTQKLAFLREAKLAQLDGILRDHGEHPSIREEMKKFYDPAFIGLTAGIYRRFASQVNLVDESYLRSMLQQPGTVLFEGAQGVLLDERFGFFPYCTRSATTFRNAERLLEQGDFDGQRYRLGLTRAYATRHGAGPFVTESADLTHGLPDRHNGDNPWQRSFRVGHLDLVALRYGLEATGPIDGLAVTNLDRLREAQGWHICERYRYTGSAGEIGDYFESIDGLIAGINLPPDPGDLARQEYLTGLLFDMRPELRPWNGGREQLAEHIARALGVPLALSSYGPTAREKVLHEDGRRMVHKISTA
jgi:adenylosuccinate synthase